MDNSKGIETNKESVKEAISTAIDMASRLGKMGDAHILPEQRAAAFAYYELQSSLDEAVKRLQAAFKVGEDLCWEEFNSAIAAAISLR